MAGQNGGSGGGWKARPPPPSGLIPALRDLGRAAADLILPPLAHDSREATASAGLSPDAWSRIVFLDGPVCDGCGAPFEHDIVLEGPARCLGCQARPFRFERARAACVYDEASRGLILRFKHGDQPQFGPLFARWISRAAADLVAEADAVAPVPLHPLRLLSRRFNQAAEIARPLARAAGLDYLPDALERLRATPSQGGRSGRGRRENVRGAFRLTPTGARRVKGRRILLVDDVLTTGATAEACARALLDGGARAGDLVAAARVRTAREDIM